MANRDGPGWVYLMTYETADSRIYKIGETSRDPEIRRREIETREQQQQNNNDIQMNLVGFGHARQRKVAEREAQEAASGRLDRIRDTRDWFQSRPEVNLDDISNMINEYCENSWYKKIQCKMAPFGTPQHKRIQIFRHYVKD